MCIQDESLFCARDKSVETNSTRLRIFAGIHIAMGTLRFMTVFNVQPMDLIANARLFELQDYLQFVKKPDITEEGH